MMLTQGILRDDKVCLFVGSVLKFIVPFQNIKFFRISFCRKELYSANHFISPDNDSTEAAAILF